VEEYERKVVRAGVITGHFREEMDMLGNGFYAALQPVYDGEGDGDGD